MKYTFITILGLLATSCSMFGPRNYKVPPPPEEIKIPQIGSVVTLVGSKLNSSYSKVEGKALVNESKAENIIETSKAKIEQKSKDTKDWILIQREAEGIKTNSREQIEILEDSKYAIELLGKLNYELLMLDEYLKQVEEKQKVILTENGQLRKVNAKLNKELNLMKENFAETTQWIWMGVIGLCALGLIVGVVMLVNGMKTTGMSLIGGAFILAPIAYFMGTYGWLMAIAGGVIFFVVAGISIYEFYINRKALLEIARPIEAMKTKEPGMWKQFKKELTISQSSSTKKLVSNTIKPAIAKKVEKVVSP